MTKANTAQSGEWETVEIAVKDAPDVRFEGRLIASISSRDATRQREREKTRWTELEVYELRSGDWVTAAVGCSDKADEIDFANPQSITMIGGFDFQPVDDGTMQGFYVRAPKSAAAMRRAVMDAFGWSWLAKELADSAGWDVAAPMVWECR